MGICFFVISDYTVKQKYKSLGFRYLILIWATTIMSFARAQLFALLFANIFQFKFLLILQIKGVLAFNSIFIMFFILYLPVTNTK